MITFPVRTVGVEEELLVVDPRSGEPRAVAAAVLDRTDATADDLTGELQLEQLETGTRPCRDLAELAAELDRTRGVAARAAAEVGAAVVVESVTTASTNRNINGFSSVKPPATLSVIASST